MQAFADTMMALAHGRMAERQVEAARGRLIREARAGRTVARTTGARTQTTPRMAHLGEPLAASQVARTRPSVGSLDQAA
jgi:hypothetical protein